MNKTLFYVIVAVVAFVADQVTKLWAESHGLGWSIQILGDFLRFTLVYNENAAFSLKPQSILPWLSPTIFFGTLTVIACVAAIFFFRSLPRHDYFAKFGIVLIIAGALGNFSDRLRLGKVIDWIDSDFPIIFDRWPTFNLADSCVTVAIVLLFISSFLNRKQNKPETECKP